MYLPLLSKSNSFNQSNWLQQPLSVYIQCTRSSTMYTAFPGNYIVSHSMVIFCNNNYTLSWIVFTNKCWIYLSSSEVRIKLTENKSRNQKTDFCFEKSVNFWFQVTTYVEIYLEQSFTCKQRTQSFGEWQKTSHIILGGAQWRSQLIRVAQAANK